MVSQQCDTIVVYGDESLAVEVANGFFICFLAHLEAVNDEFGWALIAEIAMTTIIF